MDKLQQIEPVNIVFKRMAGQGAGKFLFGSFDQLADGIHKKLFPLPDDTIVFPGHGPPTTVGHERRTNPYVKIVGEEERANS